MNNFISYTIIICKWPLSIPTKKKTNKHRISLTIPTIQRINFVSTFIKSKYEMSSMLAYLYDDGDDDDRRQ